MRARTTLYSYTPPLGRLSHSRPVRPVLSPVAMRVAELTLHPDPTGQRPDRGRGSPAAMTSSSLGPGGRAGGQEVGAESSLPPP